MADWPTTWKATLLKVGNFAKEGNVATKSALFRGGFHANKAISTAGGNFTKEVEVAKDSN
jgi:hypothetical protein